MAVQHAEVMRLAAERAIADPQWFYTNILHFPAQDWQVEATHAVFDVRRFARGERTVVNHDGLPRVTLRSCHGPGKTQFLGMLSHIWNFTTPGKIAVTAPKEAQLTRRYLPRYRKCLSKAEPSYRQLVEVLGKEIRFLGDPDWGVVLETASDPENLAGYHDTPQLFLVDEASARRLEAMFPVIEGALTTPGSVVVEIGNPTRTEGEFYNHHMHPQVSKLYYKMHIKPEDAPQLIARSWIDAMIQKYGRESPITKIRAFGEFAAFDEYLLIQPEYIEDALDTEEESDGSHPFLRVSIDVADGGTDSTVITVARHYDTFMQVLKQQQFYFKPSVAPLEAYRTAVRMFEGFGGNKADDVFVVDGLGVGAGTAGKLIEDGYNVTVFKGSQRSSDPERWRNKRVQTYMALYEQFRDGKIRITPGAVDDEEELRAHLLSIKRAQSERDDIEPKSKIKRDGLPSPDRGDSLMMQCIGKVLDYGSSDDDEMIILGTLESEGYDASLV